MNKLKVNDNKTGFVLDGKPFFYLADTIWSAFTNVTYDEWEYYLKTRKEQGFNVLQINTMPQWDRCMSDIGIYPFATTDGSEYDYTKWNDEYYKHAKKLCSMATDMGFQLALVVLWLNFVPDTWGSRISTRNIMPIEFIREYTKHVVDEFDEFNPIYVISGDTDFKSETTIEYYKIAMDTVCELSPDSLKTMHICRANDTIPEVFVDKMDFYMFQSGHNRDGQDMAYILPQRFIEKYPKKPIINAEPCYEQMGYSRRIYGRFLAEDLRKAALSSILAGACAGVTYGAHGIWNWYKINKRKNPIAGEGFDTASPWEVALLYPGAWDYGWIRQFFIDKNIDEVISANDKLEQKSDEIRAGITPNGTYLIYLPHSTKVVINNELTGYQARAIDMETKRIACLDLHIESGQTIISMYPFQADALIMLEKNK